MVTAVLDAEMKPRMIPLAKDSCGIRTTRTVCLKKGNETMWMTNP
jgi:hypothetical protein